MGKLLIALKRGLVATTKVLQMVEMSSHGSEARLERQLLGSNVDVEMTAAMTSTLAILLPAEERHHGHEIATVALTIVVLILILAMVKTAATELHHHLAALHHGNNLLLPLVDKHTVAMQATRLLVTVALILLNQAWEPLQDLVLLLAHLAWVHHLDLVLQDLVLCSSNLPGAHLRLPLLALHHRHLQVISRLHHLPELRTWAN